MPITCINFLKLKRDSQDALKVTFDFIFSLKDVLRIFLLKKFGHVKYNVLIIQFQSLAYGLLAGLAPINGVYLEFFQCFVFSLLSTVPQNSMGTFSIISLMSGSGNVINEKKTEIFIYLNS